MPLSAIDLLDYAGVAVFAATGALAASRKQLDNIGFLFLASVTGIGGGTLRDVILNLPVFWVGNSGYVLICAVVAVLVFFIAHRVESRWKWLLWLDAIGLAAFSVMGAAKGLAITGSPVVSVIMGVLTATFGGILRDLLAGEPSVLLRPEIYVSAALAASRKQLDIIGFLFLASVTGIGGGTLRDVILNLPVFWVANSGYVLVCAAVAVLVFFSAHRVESRWKWLLWLDAIGLAAFSVMGAAKGLAITGSPVVSVITGVLTATFGGILRDLLAGEPSVLLRPEIYVTAALAGAGLYTLGDLAGLPPLASDLAGFVAAFLVRGGALKFVWTFPSYKSRPGRRPEDIP